MGTSGKKFTGKSALRLIFQQLDKSAKEQLNTVLVPPKYTSLSAKQLYAQFLKVVPDHKGLVSSSHASYGVQFDLELYMDFGNLLFPPGVTGGVPINFSGGGTYLGSALLVVSRMFPRKLMPLPPQNPQPGSSPTGNTTAAGTQPNTTPVWQTSKPVSFNSMFGATKGIQISLDASLAFSKSPDVWSAKKDLEKKDQNAKYFGYVGLPVGVGGGGKVSGNVYKHWMYLKDIGPGWYSRGVSKTLLADFKTVLGDVSKTDIKVEALRWLDKYASLYKWDVTFKSTPESDTQKEAARKAYLAERKKLWIGYFKNIQVKIGEAETKKEKQATSPGLGGLIANMTVDNVTSLTKGLGSLIDQVDAKSQSSQDIINSIDALLKILPSRKDIPVVAWNPQDQGKLATALDEIKQTGKSLKARLTNAQNLKTTGTKNDLPKKIGTRNVQPFHQYLSFLKMVSIGGEAKALGTGGASVVTLDVGIKGMIKSSRYRFQNYAISSRRGTLVYTQETAIQYKQVSGTASAGLLWFSKGSDKELYNTVTYRSTCIYWKYPTGTVSSVTAETGSGVSFGTTLVLSDLSACANLLIGSSPLSKEAQDMIDTLATQLRVSPEILERFLRSEFIANLKPEDVGGRTAILIESSFRFGNGLSIDVVGKTKQTKKQPNPVSVYRIDELEKENSSIPTYLSVFKEPANNQDKNYLTPVCERLLDGLRLRVRIGDSTESETPFRIGPHLIGVSGPGITLKEIKRAGEEGVIDIFEVRFGQGVVNNPASPSPAAPANPDATKQQLVGEMGPKTKEETEQGYLYYEDCVPPVMLLFQ